MKKSFVLYTDQYEPIKNLSDTQQAELLRSMFSYHMGEKVEIKDPVAKMAFEFFKQTFVRDNDKYLERCKKNKENAKKRWDAIECDGIRKDAKHADSDSDSDSDNKYARQIISDTIEYLNRKTKSKYTTKNKKNNGFINSRIKEGFGIDDFKQAIDNKSSEWLGTEMEKFLRPETLFGNKFESYLNQKPVKPIQTQTVKSEFFLTKEDIERAYNEPITTP